MTENREAARRWRLVLGRHAQGPLPLGPSGTDPALDATLGYLYDREYTARGMSAADGSPGGGLEGSFPTAVSWLDGARRLFPESTIERLERDALTRYGLTDLLADPDAVDSITPNVDLAAALLRTKGRLDPGLAAGVRALIAKVVADIVQRLRPPLTTSLSGQRHHGRRSPHASMRNFDWRGTIAANLGNVDPATGKMLVDDVRFVARQRRRNLNWEVIIVVDQSGSMASSLLHSAITASIMAGLPGLSVRLLLFDTSVVDLSHLADDPVEVLMTAQLGGGTNIAAALQHAATLVSQPTHTVLTLISDFDEGGSIASLIRTTAGLAESGVTLLGLAALSDDGQPWYNHEVARRLSDVGMEIGAMTPDHFAAWLAEVTR